MRYVNPSPHPLDEPIGPALERLEAVVRRVCSDLRSDHCPKCQRIGACNGELDCAEYRRQFAAAMRRLSLAIAARLVQQ